mgnify:CR=1 FL=1
MLATVEKEVNSAKEMLSSDMLQSFLNAYSSQTLQVMSPFSSMLVSPTVMMIEAKHNMMRLEVESDLLTARLLQLRWALKRYTAYIWLTVSFPQIEKEKICRGTQCLTRLPHSCRE